jgi:hypothetical protein
MLTLEQCQKILSTETVFSDTLKGTEIRDELYRFAELAFEIYWSEMDSGSKNPLGLLSVGGNDTSI